MTGAVGAVRVARWLMWAAVPGELVVCVLLLGDVRLPALVVGAAEALMGVVLAFQGAVLLRLYVRERRGGLGRRAALKAAVNALVPVQLWRLTRHELLALHSLGLWVLRRRHGVRAGDRAAAYTGPQTAMLFGLTFVAVIETVALAVLIPWPVVHLVVLVLDVYTVVQLLGLHAACVTRPHVAGPDGSLRIRYGALLDIRIPARLVRHARVERRYPAHGKHMYVDTAALDGDGALDVVIGGQTTVCVELTEPVTFVRPLGKRAHARVLRFNADEPREFVAALRSGTAPVPVTPERKGPSPRPGRPG